jgi:hypothetical protein
MVVLRKIDFETGDLSQIGAGDVYSHHPDDIPVVVQDIVHAGKYALRCAVANLSPSRRSSVVRLWNIPLKPVLHYDFWLFIPYGYEVPYDHNTMMICEWYPQNEVGADEFIALYFNDASGVKNNISLRFNNNTGNFALLGIWPIFSGVEMPTRRWVHFQISYRHDLINGEVQVKMDGKIIMDYKGRTAFDNSPDFTQFAFGTYFWIEEAPLINAAAFYYDDIYIADEPNAQYQQPAPIPLWKAALAWTLGLGGAFAVTR